LNFKKKIKKKISIDFFKKYFLILMDRVTDEQSLSVYSRELKKISAYTTSTVTSPMKLFSQYFIEGWNIIILNATINH